MSQYTITGFDASAHMAEETHEASRMAAVGMYMSVVASVIFGWILLLAVTFAIPDTTGRRRRVGGIAVIYIWQTSMSKHWAEILLFICCVAQMFCLTASVTSASRMMFAFSRDGAVPGPGCGGRSRRTACRGTRCSRSASLSWALMVPTLLEQLRRLSRRDVDRRDRPLHRVRAPGLSFAGAGRRTSSAAPGTSATHYKWIDPLAIVWIVLICILFMFPIAPAGIPFKKGFDWNIVNYAPVTVGGAFLLFGGWFALSAKKWFKGPVRMGTEEELARIEAEQEKQFDFPAESPA